MRYDPVKDRMGAFVRGRPVFQRLFFALLHLVFLRSWYVRRALRSAVTMRNGHVQVLDAGTGFGQYAWFIARSFPSAHVLAVDIKEDYLEHARAFFAHAECGRRVRFERDDLTDLRVDGPFDCILSVDVLEHIEDDRAVLRHFARVTRPGGVVLISTPSNLGGSDTRHAGDAGFIDEHVRTGYGLPELEAKLRDEGLEITSGSYTYGRWGVMAWRILIRLPITALNRSWAWFPLLLPYWALALPAGLVLNAMDVRANNVEGAGLFVVARKPE